MYLSWLCTTLLMMTGLLLVFIILLQRGRGGGLAGAFGGAGGHSAFGTKAGDVFTKITIVLTVLWVVMAGVTGFAMRHDAQRSSGIGDTATENPDGEVTPALGEKPPVPKPKPTKPKTPETKTKISPVEKTKTKKTSAKTGKS